MACSSFCDEPPQIVERRNAILFGDGAPDERVSAMHVVAIGSRRASVVIVRELTHREARPCAVDTHRVERVVLDALREMKRAIDGPRVNAAFAELSTELVLNSRNDRAQHFFADAKARANRPAVFVFFVASVTGAHADLTRMCRLERGRNDQQGPRHTARWPRGWTAA